jgi:N utilization substance protein A
VARVIIDAGSHTMELIVPDDKLSLAIGKKGQNVRLASQLTGWRIDIHSESKVREMEQRSRVSLAAIEGVVAETADALFKLGWRSAADVANAKPEELASVAGIANPDAARKIISAAGRAAEVERKAHAEEMARVAQAEREAAEAGAAAAAAAAEHGEGSPPAPPAVAAAPRTPGGP